MFVFLFAYNPAMGLDISGYEDRPDWPKIGAVIAHRNMPNLSDTDSEVDRQVT
jgi:hypothetical protein